MCSKVFQLKMSWGKFIATVGLFGAYISTVVLYCLMKVKAESDELYEELMRKHFYGRSDDIPASDKTEHLKGCG